MEAKQKKRPVKTAIRYSVKCCICGKEEKVHRHRAERYKTCSNPACISEWRSTHFSKQIRDQSFARNKPAADYAKEHGVAAAAKKFGIPYQTIYQFCKRNSLPIQKTDINQPPDDVDLALEVMKAMAPGWTWSQYDIAEVTGLSPERIRQITQKALRKLRNRISREDAKELSLYHKN